jgi:hypothetical protein
MQINPHITASQSGIRSSRRSIRPPRLSQASQPPIPQFLTQPFSSAPHDPPTHSSHDSSSDSEPEPKRHKLTTTQSHSLTSANVRSNTTLESLEHYPLSDLPDIALHTKLVHSSEFRDEAVFSDPAGRFPVIVRDLAIHFSICLQKIHPP